MEHTSGGFVLKPGPLRIVLLTVTFVICAAVFLFMAAILIMIDVDSLLARFALVLGALVLVALAVFFLLLLRTNIVRVEVGPERFKLRMPRVRGPVPLLGSIKADLPYSAVASVETREEVYSTFGLVTEQRAYSVVTRDGVRLPLGTMVENRSAPLQLRFDQVAARIAERAGTSVVERGAVMVGGTVRAIIHDAPPWSTEAMAAPESEAWHQRAILSVQLIAVLGLAVALLRACAGS